MEGKCEFKKVRDFDPVFVSFSEVSRASLLTTFDAISDYIIMGPAPLWDLKNKNYEYVLRKTRKATTNDSSESPNGFPPCYKCSALPLELAQDLLGLTVLSRFGNSGALRGNSPRKQLEDHFHYSPCLDIDTGLTSSVSPPSCRTCVKHFRPD